VPNEDADILTFDLLLQVLRRRLWIILLVVTIFVGVATGFSIVQKPVYEATILVLVKEPQVDNSDNSAPGIQFEVEGLKAITPTMARAAISRPVVEDAINQLDLPTTPEDLTARLNAEPVTDTQFISITYEDSSPERTQRVVNTVGDVFSEHVPDLSPIATPISAVVWERAVIPNEPIGPNVGIYVTLALVTGIILGVLAAFMLEGLSRIGALRNKKGKQKV
jgi:capsular polysaccharide biosynthesis protein